MDDAPPPVEAPAPPAPPPAGDAAPSHEKKERTPVPMLKRRVFFGGGAYAGSGRGAGGIAGYHQAYGSPVVAFVVGGAIATTGHAEGLSSLDSDETDGVVLMPDLGFRVDLRANAKVATTTVVGGSLALALPMGVGPAVFTQAGSTFRLASSFAIDTVAETRIMWINGRAGYFVTAQTGMRF